MKIKELKKAAKKRVGRIVTNNVHLEPHEYDTILFLVSYGFDIEVIKPNNSPNSKNPDFIINGAIWETKSPEGSSKYTIQRKMHEAGRQASNLILDLRRIKISAKKAESDAVKRFGYSKRIKRLMLITKDGTLLDIKQ